MVNITLVKLVISLCLVKLQTLLMQLIPNCTASDGITYTEKTKSSQSEQSKIQHGIFMACFLVHDEI